MARAIRNNRAWNGQVCLSYGFSWRAVVLRQDDPRNPATIADNVGDNVGDVAGMGADLFGSYAESTCAALVVAATCPELVDAGWSAIVFPMEVRGSFFFFVFVSRRG